MAIFISRSGSSHVPLSDQLASTTSRGLSKSEDIFHSSFCPRLVLIAFALDMYSIIVAAVSKIIFQGLFACIDGLREPFWNGWSRAGRRGVEWRARVYLR